MTNKLNTLHGGFTASLVDSISTLALMTTDIAGVSVDLSVRLVINTLMKNISVKKFALKRYSSQLKNIMISGHIIFILVGIWYLTSICLLLNHLLNTRLLEIMKYIFHKNTFNTIFLQT